MDHDVQQAAAYHALTHSIQTSRDEPGIRHFWWGVGNGTFEQAVGLAIGIYEWLTAYLDQQTPPPHRCFLGFVYSDATPQGRTVIATHLYTCALPLNGADTTSLGALINDIIRTYHPDAATQTEIWAAFPPAAPP